MHDPIRCCLAVMVLDLASFGIVVFQPSQLVIARKGDVVNLGGHLWYSIRWDLGGKKGERGANAVLICILQLAPNG